MSLQKKVRDLELLSLARQYQKNFSRNYRLQRKGLYEQSDDLFKPLLVKQNEVLEQQEKQTEAIKALCEVPMRVSAVGQKPDLPIEFKTNNTGTKPLSKTWLFKQNANVDFFLNDHLLIIKDGNIRLANSNSSYPFTDNLNASLNRADISSIDNKEALVNYNNITTEAKSSKSSVRSKRLLDWLKDKFKGEGVITISENPKELWDRLKVLTAASREGHNNSLEEKTENCYPR